MLNVIRSVASNKRTALTHSPFGEFAVLAMLLVCVQIGLNGNTPEYNTGKSQALTPAAIAQINELVDLINPDVDATTNSTRAVVGILAASPVSNARFTFAVDTATAQSESESIINADAIKQFQFKPSFQSNLNRVSASFANAETQRKTELAIWDINKQFSLAEKKRAPSIYLPPKKRKQNENFVIMIDPGHGGSDPGSKAHNGLLEKALTLDIAKRALHYLKDVEGVEVQLTRYDDTGMSRKSRVRKVRNSNADMVVSLHLNHLPQKHVNLVETFYAAPHNIMESINKQRSAASENGLYKANAPVNVDLSFTHGSRKMANIMQKNIYNEVQKYNPITSDSGVKEDTLYILTRSFTPGVLIEVSCLSNVREAELLAKPAYRNKLAAAMADGIKDYLKTPEAKRQFGPGV